jgi:hypothetical protein
MKFIIYNYQRILLHYCIIALLHYYIKIMNSVHRLPIVRSLLWNVSGQQIVIRQLTTSISDHLHTISPSIGLPVINQEIKLTVSRSPKTKFTVSRSPKTKFTVSRSPKTKFTVSRSPKTKFTVSRSPKTKFILMRSPKTKFILSQIKRRPTNYHDILNKLGYSICIGSIICIYYGY